MQTKLQSEILKGGLGTDGSILKWILKNKIWGFDLNPSDSGQGPALIKTIIKL
jgi:hypothetical protein